MRLTARHTAMSLGIADERPLATASSSSGTAELAKPLMTISLEPSTTAAGSTLSSRGTLAWSLKPNCTSTLGHSLGLRLNVLYAGQETCVAEGRHLGMTASDDDPARVRVQVMARRWVLATVRMVVVSATITVSLLRSSRVSGY